MCERESQLSLAARDRYVYLVKVLSSLMKVRCWWGGDDDVGAPSSSGPIPYYVLEARVKSPICFHFLVLDCFLCHSLLCICYI